MIPNKIQHDIDDEEATRVLYANTGAIISVVEDNAAPSYCLEVTLVLSQSECTSMQLYADRLCKAKKQLVINEIKKGFGRRLVTHSVL